MTRSADILLVSLDEAAALTGTRDPFQAFAALRGAGARCLLIRIRRKDDGGRSEKLQDCSDPW
jgi:sugar/nucleoside kinase (ribokinase family)